jgi:hypothetical protein
MFTVVAHKNLGDAESYFDEHLAQNDSIIKPPEKSVLARVVWLAPCKDFTTSPSVGPSLENQQLVRNDEDKSPHSTHFKCAAKILWVLRVILLQKRDGLT